MLTGAGSLGMLFPPCLPLILYTIVANRLIQGRIVVDLRTMVYDKMQRLSFRFFDVHGSSSIFNRVTGDVQNTRLFVDGVSQWEGTV